MKRFKAKKKFKGFKIFLFLGLSFLLYQLTTFIFTDLKLVSGNEEFIKKLLTDSNYHVLYEKQDKNLFGKFFSFVTDLDLTKPATILAKSFNNSNDDITFNYIANPNPVSNKEPRVFIYSTHQTEGYAGKGLDAYGITPNVLMASYIMQDKLNDMGISTLVLEESIPDYLKNNNLLYKESYKATRYYLTEALKKHQNFDLVIDLHRDALKKDLSTVTIGEKTYAKILFVQNPNYKSNMELTNKLNDVLKAKYPGISRGIYDKYPDTFNQDLNGNAILLELGGNYNTIDEVLNSIDAVTYAIGEVLK